MNLCVSVYLCVFGCTCMVSSCVHVCQVVVHMLIECGCKRLYVCDCMCVCVFFCLFLLCCFFVYFLGYNYIYIINFLV